MIKNTQEIKIEVDLLIDQVIIYSNHFIYSLKDKTVDQN